MTSNFFSFEVSKLEGFKLTACFERNNNLRGFTELQHWFEVSAYIRKQLST